MALASCGGGPTAEEKAALEQLKMDSIKAVEQAAMDAEAAAAAAAAEAEVTTEAHEHEHEATTSVDEVVEEVDSQKERGTAVEKGNVEDQKKRGAGTTKGNVEDQKKRGGS